jgi:alpha-amylase
MKKTTKILFFLYLLINSKNVFAFKPLPFVKNTNIYEVNVRQYTPEGTFKAFAEHIPRLQAMGVKTLWFMPIQPIGVTNRKGSLGSYYSVKDYKGINPEFGTLQDFKDIVNQAHRLGIKVMIDWVANHTAWDNAWVTEHPEYYHKDSNGRMHSPYDWADVVQVDTASEAVHNAHIDALQYWVKETNIDGYRCDVANFLPLRFWIKARTKVDAIKPLIWLAECGDDKYFQAFDILYGWEWLHKMEDYYKGKTNITDVKKLLNKYYDDYKQDKFRILFTSNHDENSWSGSEYERLNESATTFATLCATLPGIPLVYSGQEEPIAKRLKFFEKDNINFNKFKLHTFYQSLLSNNTAFDNKKTELFLNTLTATDPNILVYPNKNNTAEVYVYNLSNTNNTITLSQQIKKTGKGKQKSQQIKLAPWEVKLIPQHIVVE